MKRLLSILCMLPLWVAAYLAYSKFWSGFTSWMLIMVVLCVAQELIHFKLRRPKKPKPPEPAPAPRVNGGFLDEAK